jgi:UDP-GlcNAc:undecaprenyl-phosphate GlcNAc-1-phosphate transferase
MLSVMLVWGVSFGLGLLLTPLARALAARVNLVDRPDGHRKKHARTTPVAGGLAVLLAGVGAVAVGLAASPPAEVVSGPGAEGLHVKPLNLWGLLLSAVLICALGVVDDFRRLRGRQKLFGQLVAVAIVIQSGVLVEKVSFFNRTVDLGLLSWPFTVFWLLGAINSLNLIDGMDGLLSSVALIISLGIAVIVVLQGNWTSAYVALALAGALLAFLFYNFPPASIFLGDSGSMLIGLVVGVLAIHSSLKGPATVAMATPLALLAIPIIDTSAAIIRRKLTGRSIYTTDRGHLHHCMLRRGLSNQRVLVCVSFLCLVAVVGAMASMAFRSTPGGNSEGDLLAVLAGCMVIGILVMTNLFGNAEFLLIKKFLLAKTVSTLRGRANGEADQLEVCLQGSVDWGRLWDTILASAGELNLASVRLDVNAPALHENYHARWDRGLDPGEPGNHWRAEIPLVAQGHPLGRLEISGPRDDEPVWMKIATVAKMVDDLELAASALADSAIEAAAVGPKPPGFKALAPAEAPR